MRPLIFCLCAAALGLPTQPRRIGSETRRSRFRAINPLRIHCAPSSDALQAAIELSAREDDIVLECGCQLGATTALLAERCRQVIGVDLARSLDVSKRASASRVHATAADAGLPPTVRLECLDVFDTRALQSACPEPVSLIVIDISSALGADMPLAALALCRQLGRIFAPSLRAVLIKSRAVARLERSLTTGAALLSAELGPPPQTDQKSTGPAAAAGSSRGVFPVGAKALPRRAISPIEVMPGSAAPAVRSVPWRVVCTVGVFEYRAAAVRLLESELPRPARVLEIGCHLGTTTALLNARAYALGGGSAIGVDVSRRIVERARRLHPSVAFEKADAWDVVAIQEVGRGACLLLLDVGGVSSAHAELDAIALLAQLRSALPSLRAAVVKSHCLRSLASQLQPWRGVGAGGARQAAAAGAAAARLGLARKGMAHNAEAWDSVQGGSSAPVQGESLALVQRGALSPVSAEWPFVMIEAEGALEPLQGALEPLQGAWEPLQGALEPLQGALEPVSAEGLPGGTGPASQAQPSEAGDATRTMALGRGGRAQGSRQPDRRDNSGLAPPGNRQSSEARRGSEGEQGAQGATSLEDAVLPAVACTPTQLRLRRVLASRHGGLCVVLENVEKENVALLGRTLECLGVGALHLVYSADHLQSKYSGGALHFGRLGPAARAAALSRLSRGATDWIEVSTHESVAQCASELRTTGYNLLLATAPPPEADGAPSGAARQLELYPLAGVEPDWATQRVALVFGSEGGGLSPAAFETCDAWLSVPQLGMTQSLNVAVCATLVVGEVVRRRSAAEAGMTLQESEGGSGEVVRPFGLSVVEQREAEARIMPEGQPRRLHNKSAVKAMRREGRARDRPPGGT